LMIFLNDSFEGFAKLSRDRISGDATVYVSSPWNPPAIAKVSGIKMAELKSFTAPVSRVNGVLKKGLAVEMTTVPADYALSFNITPLGVVSGWSSIIHYSGDGSNQGAKGRMPAIGFTAGSTRLAIRVATTSNPSELFDSTLALPLNAQTNVRLEAVGKDLMIFLNDSFEGFAKLSANRISGNATVYVSSPWNSPAIAKVSGIKMAGLKTMTSPSKVPIPYNEKGEPVLFSIYNSVFDDCSEEEGADAGCGRNLKCRTFLEGQPSCRPKENVVVNVKHSSNVNQKVSIIVSNWHQTCGKSSRYNNICASDGVPLFCTPVEAIVNGEIGEKSICLIEAEREMQQLQKRVVTRRQFCYSGCDQSVSSFGRLYKGI
jgi:hypothetical protein